MTAPSVIHKRDADKFPNVVYIGRPTKWGNPFVIGQDGTRKEVIAKYRAYVLSNKDLLADVKAELKGKTLSCWCKPKACHGDVLLQLSNAKSLFS